MEQPLAPDGPQAWQREVDPGLVRRLWQRTAQPGCVRHGQAQAVLARHERMAAGPPLAELLLQRAAASGDDGPAEPPVTVAGAEVAPVAVAGAAAPAAPMPQEALPVGPSRPADLRAELRPALVRPARPAPVVAAPAGLLRGSGNPASVTLPPSAPTWAGQPGASGARQTAFVPGLQRPDGVLTRGGAPEAKGTRRGHPEGSASPATSARDGRPGRRCVALAATGSPGHTGHPGCARAAVPRPPVAGWPAPQAAAACWRRGGRRGRGGRQPGNPGECEDRPRHDPGEREKPAGGDPGGGEHRPACACARSRAWHPARSPEPRLGASAGGGRQPGGHCRA